MLAISDPYVAYCLDEACHAWGSFIESELNDVDGKDAKAIHAKRVLVLKGLLSENEAARYATPVATR